MNREEEEKGRRWNGKGEGEGKEWNLLPVSEDKT